MRTHKICAATLALAASLGCSDGTGLVPNMNAAMAGSTSTPQGGQPSSTGGSGVVSPTGGSGVVNPMGGSDSTTGGSGVPQGGQGGSGNPSGGSTDGGTATGGTGTMGGSGGGGTVDAYTGPFKILVLATAIDFPHDSIPICSLMVGIEGQFLFSGLKVNNQPISGASLRAYVEGKSGPGSGRAAQLPNLGATPDAMMPPGTKPGSQWTADLAKDDMSDFTDENLKKYAMVFSCNPTGTVFSANPNIKDDKNIHMMALQKFVESGGAWAGVHSATDFEKSNGYPWFINTLVGGYFQTHDNDGTQGTVQVASMFAAHPVMKGVPATWSAQDEWYYMNRDVGAQPGFQIIERLASDNRPVTWVKEFGMGRMFYTIRGHNMDRYDKEPAFRQLVLNGILWATHRLN